MMWKKQFQIHTYIWEETLMYLNAPTSVDKGHGVEDKNFKRITPSNVMMLSRAHFFAHLMNWHN